MKIHIPNSAFIGNIETFLRGFNANDPDCLNVSFHPKWVSVHPCVLAMAASLGLFCRERGGQPSAEIPEIRSLPYLIRMKLFEFLGVNPPASIVEHEAAGRFIPLTQIKTSLDLNKFITDMVPLLHASPAEADPIKYVMSELIRNVLEHSQSRHGAIVCAQFFKKTNRVAIGVADTGIGVKKAMTIHAPKNDLDALSQSLRPGVTGTTRRFGGTETNAGAGLFFTRNIAKVGRNHFFIYSGAAGYKLRKIPQTSKMILYADPQRDKNTSTNDFPYWSGTVVGIDITTQSNQTFASLLKLIRSAYSLDVKQQKKEFFKRPKFV
jgi:anti-sigma regulatory factor (Ser/Thr protein kinase)